VTLIFCPQKAVKNAVTANATSVCQIAKNTGDSALANIANLIQRWRPKRATPKGAKNAPKKTPIPAIVNAIPKPCKPSSGLAGSLKVLRSSNNAVRVNAVSPPRCTAVAMIPRAVSIFLRRKSIPSRISVKPCLKDAAAFSCSSGPISYLVKRPESSAAIKYPPEANKINKESA